MATGTLPLLLKSPNPLPNYRKSQALKIPASTCSFPSRPSRRQTCTPSAASSPASCFQNSARRLLQEFDPSIPIEEALTPPSSWYTDPSFLQLEFEAAFHRGWQAVGIEFGAQEFLYVSPELRKNSQVIIMPDCGEKLGSVQFVVCRDANGNLNAFHNVCRHHASLVTSGGGKKSCFVCPYHGWTYGLDGELLKATRIANIQNFDVKDFGLIPLNVATWGPFVLINIDGDKPLQSNLDDRIVQNDWLGSSAETLATGGIDTLLSHVRRCEYTIKCNWKVFCDNYLDGGYHVPYAHGGLAFGLKLDSYTTSIFEKVSVQKCKGASAEREDHRLGKEALYAFVYPNFMINRYGPWMDTNLVLPLGSSKCQVIFDYFLEASLKDDEAFIDRSLLESDRVQMEDIMICESVQKGLESPAYRSGRYAPTVEMAMHHFHCLLHKNLIGH